jgi:methanogenic corrinoid protein MtbC1
MKISKIAALSDKQLIQNVQNLEKTVSEDSICEGFINNLIASMLTFDESAFEKVLSSAVVRFGMYESMIRVFYPFLKKTGLMWSSSEAMPVQEHFASAIIRRKLIVAIDGLPLASKKSKTFLLFLPANEWHETGLLLSDFIIRSKGFKTIYLSQNVPVQNLQDVINNVKPSHLLTLYIARQDKEKLHTEINNVAAHNKGCQLLIGGNPELLKTVKKAKNIHLLSSPADFVKWLK